MAASQAPVSSPNLLTLGGGLHRNLPSGFAHDLCRSEIGRGGRAFEAARLAIQKWKQFDLGWVRVINPYLEISSGELVAVEAHTVCFWSINFSRVVEVVNRPAQFGFMYTTTALHVEEGQERFVIEFDSERESVFYVIEAISRPRHVLARIGYPISRAMQHRFQRDSTARMKRAVLES
ncbi:MAG TPA: DUF1990 domain-containing protein [Acidobacteriaceae bacterium]|nr:DUF1990 domain-containing protein [Acidobacteriaceae bacterium]